MAKSPDDNKSDDSNDVHGRHKYEAPRLDDVQTKYELFATICFDAKNLDNMAYYPLVKKRHKQTNKPQWYVFTEGEFNKVKRSQALKDYFP